MENKDKLEKILSLPVSIVIAALILAGAWLYNSKLESSGSSLKTDLTSSQQAAKKTELEEKVLPSEGVELPVSWNDMGMKLISAGAIDEKKFKALYEQRGQFTQEYEKLLSGNNNSNLPTDKARIKINEENAGYLLNLFWALGLSNDNPILFDKTEMANPRYAGSGKPAAGFAATGGWTMAVGDPMDHYGRHRYFNLTPEQQALVDKVSRGIYRPCCGNSTHFPDCNHGMAMLGLLELMASQGVSEQDMWKAALAVNSYWFPDTYINIATYMKNKGTDWQNVNPEEILGINYSSGSGYAKIASQVAKPAQRSTSGCGVDAGPTQPAQSTQQDGSSHQKQQSSCGI